MKYIKNITIELSIRFNNKKLYLSKTLGIPIDHVGGTSMGAFIGAIYAEHGDIVKTTQRAREGCLVSCCFCCCCYCCCCCNYIVYCCFKSHFI